MREDWFSFSMGCPCISESDSLRPGASSLRNSDPSVFIVCSMGDYESYVSCPLVMLATSGCSVQQAEALLPIRKSYLCLCILPFIWHLPRRQFNSITSCRFPIPETSLRRSTRFGLSSASSKRRLTLHQSLESVPPGPLLWLFSGGTCE